MKQRHKLTSRFAAVAVSIGLIATGLSSFGVGSAVAAPVLPYQDESLPFSVRAADLVSRMTLEEKAQQFSSTLYSGSSGEAAPAIPRLGVRTYNYWSEALHGVAREGLATEFPTGLNISGTWDRSLVQSMTDAIADEARVKTNDCYVLDSKGQPTAEVTKECKGLTYWSPTINLARDPRWGRADESYGEDPWLSGEIAGQFVLGLQGGNASKPDSKSADGNYLKAVSTPKHYLANNSEVNRHDGTSNLSDRSLHEYYTAQFGKAIQEYGAKSYMTSYNAVNLKDDLSSLTGNPAIKTGVESQFRGGDAGYTDTAVTTPVPASIYANNTLMRRMYGFDGFVTSDCGAVDNVFGIGGGFSGGHSWAPDEIGRQVTPAEGSAWSLKAGTDVDCWAAAYPRYLPQAQAAGLATEQDWDLALTRAFTIRFQLGEFDKVNPYRNADYTSAATGSKVIGSAKHQAIAHQMSLEAPVLLKNEGALPLTDKSGKTLVIGYYGEEAVHGGYSPASTFNTKSAVQGVTDFIGAAGTVEHLNPDYGFYNTAKPIPSQWGNGNLSFLGAGADVGTPVGMSATTFVPDGRGYAWNPFWGMSLFGSGPELYGYFDVKIAEIPANADTISLNINYSPWGATAVLPKAASAAPGCDAPNASPGCLTIGSFNVSAGGSSVDKGVYFRAIQDASTGSGVQNRYQPVRATLAELGLTPGQTNVSVRFNFTIPGAPAGGSTLALSSCSNASCTGVGDNTTDEYRIKNAKNVIVYIGTNENDSNEEQDRPTVDFPQSQAAMAKKVAQWNPKTVVWIQAVGQMNVSDFKNEANAIVWSTYNGQWQGDAVAEVLWNANVNLGDGRTIKAAPSGKLTYTYYSDVPNQLTKSTDYALTTAEHQLTTDPNGTICGRTYWYYRTSASCAAPDYVFGHGLTYTTFQYSNLRLSQSAATPNDVIKATVNVRNTGSLPGREVVELYAASPVANGVYRPIKQLKGFTKTAEIAPNAAVDVEVELKAADLWFWDSATQKRVYDQGSWRIQLAGSSADDAGLSTLLQLTGTRKAGVDVVSVIPDGTQLNTRTPNNVINANLSATKHDQSFWNLSDPAVKVEYSVADAAVAKVSAAGIVSPVGAGATLVTAKVTADGETKSTTFPVIVHDRRPTSGAVMESANHYTLPPKTEYTYMVNFGNTDVTLSQAKAGVRLQAGVSVSTADDSYQYQIAPMDLNENGGTVSAAGLYKADKVGKTQVTVIADVDGVKISRHAYVNVVADPVDPTPPTSTPKPPVKADPGKVTGVKVAQQTLHLVKGKTAKVNAKAYAAAGGSTALTWTSSDPKVASVDASGKVRANKAGTATIKVTAKERNAKAQLVLASFKVAVSTKSVKLKSVALTGLPAKIKVGKTVQVQGKYSPSKATGAVISFKTSNAKTATIDAAGTLVAKKAGTVKISVKAGNKTKTYKVKVVK